MGTRGSGRNVAVVSCKLQFQEIRALDAAARDAGMTRYAILQALVRRHLAQQDAADGTPLRTDAGTQADMGVSFS